MRHFTTLLLLIIVFALSSCKEVQTGQTNVATEHHAPINWNNEVIYHVMQRSFYDSNGDRHGDLNGFVKKLDYLKELGVTTILFTPLYESDFYHNYFPTNYKNIDAEYGTKTDYINFVKAVHKKGLKFLMDMETQYAQSGNIWFDDSYKNPESQYSDFIYYSDSLNQYPEQIFMPSKSPLHDFTAWPGDKHHIVFLDLNNENVKQWMTDFYLYWVDPNKDGNFDDGVDGFRIDHIMDDLDYKGLFTNMYQDFWKPIFNQCKSVNANIFVLGEQSNWNEYGEKMVNASGADAAFSFPLRFAIAGEEGTHDMYIDPTSNGVKMDPNRIHKVVRESMSKFTDSTFTINFLENHDTARWASVVNNNEGQKRVAAALNILLPGVPSIYYGQELGLTGQTSEWGSDANHIPVREAFPWNADQTYSGNALWYKDTGEWWYQSFWNTEAITMLNLETQKKDKHSLWHHYKSLISIRTKNKTFQQGTYEPLFTNQANIIAFKRELNNQISCVIINTSEDSIKLTNEDKYQLGEAIYNQNADINSDEIVLNGYGMLITNSVL
ncbi:alpha-amylase family glycosyl hydrolase [Winogradskyella sp.]|uniref:alpha-amylase family glycosyl hydrolase n=1 Tax=Winogradskyella sp. TaxID=1883156 RepID=UPI0026122287|nr:alpha-amylase family glycosyl hydrolase [Winogradskyella sp.]